MIPKTISHNSHVVLKVISSCWWWVNFVSIFTFILISQLFMQMVRQNLYQNSKGFGFVSCQCGSHHEQIFCCKFCTQVALIHTYVAIYVASTAYFSYTMYVAHTESIVAFCIILKPVSQLQFFPEGYYFFLMERINLKALLCG